MLRISLQATIYGLPLLLTFSEIKPISMRASQF